MLISGIYKLKLPVGNYKVSHRNTVREDKGYKGGTNNWFHPLFILSLHREVKINFRYDRECLLSLLLARYLHKPSMEN